MGSTMAIFNFGGIKYLIDVAENVQHIVDTLLGGRSLKFKIDKFSF